MTELPQNATDALKLMAKVQFRPFDDADWMSWAGCESADPLVGQIDDVTIVIDGNTVSFNRYGIAGETEWASFKMSFDGAC